MTCSVVGFVVRHTSLNRLFHAGLDLEKDVVIEIAVIITDGDLRNQILVRFDRAQLYSCTTFRPTKCA